MTNTIIVEVLPTLKTLSEQANIRMALLLCIYLLVKVSVGNECHYKEQS